MRKEYVKPSIELELYQLDTSIAANCDTVINYSMECAGEFSPFSLRSRPVNISFSSDEECDCYTTGGSGIYWTS